MAKFLTFWEMDMTRVSESPEEQNRYDAMLVDMVKKDLESGKTLDGGMFAGGELRGYCIDEGTELEITMMNTRYVPYIKFKILNKVTKAAEVKGLAFIDLLVPCPVGWGFDPSEGIDIGRLAVRTGIWKHYEITDGMVSVNYIPKKRRKVSEYLRAQGRFSHLSELDIAEVQAEVDEEWGELEARGYGYEIMV